MSKLSNELLNKISDVIAIDDGFRTMETAIGFTATSALVDEMETVLDETAELLVKIQDAYLNIITHGDQDEIDDLKDYEVEMRLAPQYMEIGVGFYAIPAMLEKAIAYYSLTDKFENIDGVLYI
jgi:hypothetical protein